MVVEDDDATREFLADNLRADSYRVVTAASGRQALNLLEVKDCDLVLLDVMLPDASGFELCRRLRAADGLAQRIDPDLPVIMLSGRASETDRVRGFARGADDYVAEAVPLSGAGGTDRRRAAARAVAGATRGGRQVGELRIDPVSREVTLRGAPGRAVGEGVRAAAHARRGADARLHQGGAPARRLGLQADGLHAHARLAREPAAAQAGRRGGRRWIVNVWGVGYRLTDELE